MDIRSTFRNHLNGAMGGRSEVGQPVNGIQVHATSDDEDRREIRGLS